MGAALGATGHMNDLAIGRAPARPSAIAGAIARAGYLARRANRRARAGHHPPARIGGIDDEAERARLGDQLSRHPGGHTQQQQRAVRRGPHTNCAGLTAAASIKLDKALGFRMAERQANAERRTPRRSR